MPPYAVLPPDDYARRQETYRYRWSLTRKIRKMLHATIRHVAAKARRARAMPLDDIDTKISLRCA